MAGFAGAAADAFTLFARFEGKLEEYRGNLARAAVELAKDWRSRPRAARGWRRCWPWPISEHSFIVSGTGDVIEPDDGLDRHRLRRAVRAGRGARARRPHRRSTPAADRRRRRMRIAAAICIYTNDQIAVEVL